LREGRSPGQPGLILSGDLVRAVEQEAAVAVAAYWGVSAQQVRRWRRALGVDRVTDGTRQLLAEHGNMNIGTYAMEGARASLAPEIREGRDRKHAETMREKPKWFQHMDAMNRRRKCPRCGRYRQVGSGVRGEKGRFIALPHKKKRLVKSTGGMLCAECFAEIVAQEVTEP
jgi:ribosomal protein L34E